jgi:hypothetical protein
MILLTSTTDSIRLVTSDATNIDVHVSWIDMNGSTVTPGRTNTLISTATTTTIVAAPAASTVRNIKHISIRNRGTTTASNVTVVHRESGSTDAEMIKSLLQPGNSLVYEEHSRWRKVIGPYAYKGRKSDFLSTAQTIGQLYTHVLSEDITNANATANRLINVPQLAFWVTEGNIYWFRFVLIYTAAATTTGSRFSIYGPGSVTALRYSSEYSLTTTTKTSNEGVLAYDAIAAANATSATTGANSAFVEGFIDTPTCDGEIFLRFASEVLSSAIVVKAGSTVQWMRVK